MGRQPGAISRNVVRNVLAEEGPACGFGSERRSVVVHVTAITESPRPAKRIEKSLVGGKRRQVGKEARVRETGNRRVDSPCARWREAMRVLHIQIMTGTSCNREASIYARSNSAAGLNVRVLLLSLGH